jgi:pimeloyl-ACP methyl ester carboxylesterase
MTISRVEIARMAAIKAVFQLRLPQLALKVSSAAHFSDLLVQRFVLGTNVKAPEIKTVLSSIHSFRDWPVVMRDFAAKLEREAQNIITSGNGKKGFRRLAQAALFYHYAQIVGCDNLASRLELQKKSQALYQLAAPHLFFPAARVEIPFGPVTLPGYLRLPNKEAKAVVVFINGVNTVKEEFDRLSSLFSYKGYATLFFDDPGSGEAWPRITGTTRQAAVATAVIDHLQANHPSLPRKTILFGISMGGMKAMLMAAGEPRVSGVVSVSAPFDAGKYLDQLNPLVHDEISLFFNYPGSERLRRIVEASSLENIAGRVGVPVFVAGGNKDTVLPYREAERTFAALRNDPRNSLKIYDSGHICLGRMSELLADVLAWLPKIC